MLGYGGLDHCSSEFCFCCFQDEGGEAFEIPRRMSDLHALSPWHARGPEGSRGVFRDKNYLGDCFIPLSLIGLEGYKRMKEGIGVGFIKTQSVGRPRVGGGSFSKDSRVSL